jgi:hypothetical protein
MASLGGGSMPPLPLTGPAPFAGPSSVQVPITGDDTVATSSSSLFNTPSPSTRKAKHKTPPAKYNDQQTLTQMEHIAPPPDELGLDDEDDNLPPDVETIVDASGKEVYRILMVRCSGS